MIQMAKQVLKALVLPCRCDLCERKGPLYLVHAPWGWAQMCGDCAEKRHACVRHYFEALDARSVRTQFWNARLPKAAGEGVRP
jgi:hypothetical protein